jgi:hypothetical protein
MGYFIQSMRGFLEFLFHLYCTLSHMIFSENRRDMMGWDYTAIVVHRL